MKYKKLITYILSGMLIANILYLTYYNGNQNENFKKIILLDKYSNHVINNNIALLDKKDISNNWYSDRDLFLYYDIIKLNYKYDYKYYNNKYWATNWALYLEKNNIDYTFITQYDNIIIFFKYNNNYCIAYNNILNCNKK